MPPSSSPTDGVPPVVSTVTASSKVSDASTVSSGDQVPSVSGASLRDGVPATVDATDSLALLDPWSKAKTLENARTATLLAQCWRALDEGGV